MAVRSRVTTYGFAVAVVWLYVYSFPYFAKIHSANELPRVYLTWAMVEEGTFAIDSGVARWGKTVDVSPADGRLYSNKAPGSSFLAIPGYVGLKAVVWLVAERPPTLAEMMWVCRVSTGVVPTLLFLLLLNRFLRRFAGDEARRLALCGYALGSMAMTYSILFIAHQLSAVCIAAAYVLIADVVEPRARASESGDGDAGTGRAGRRLMLAGLAAGCAPLVDYQAAFAGVPLAVYLVVGVMVRGAADGASVAKRGRDIGCAVLGSIPPIALMFLYHHQAFGHPLRTGYDASQTFAHFHQQGFLGMTEPTWEAFIGSTVTADNGLIFFCPMLLLAVPGWFLLARQRRWAHLAVTLSVAVIYLGFISSITFWRGGWQMGPRYITAMLPFVMVPVAVAMEAAFRGRLWLRIVPIALTCVGIAVYALSCSVFPHFPEVFANPLYELTFRLIGDDQAPYSLGWLVGLRGWWSLVPYWSMLVVAVALAILPSWQKRHVPAREDARARPVRAYGVAVAGLVLAGAIVLGYGWVPGGGASGDSRAARAYQWVVSVFPGS